MELYAVGSRVEEPLIRKKIPQPKWQRIILLLILGYEAAGCLLGGTLLMAAPDGRLMDMPVEIMNGAFRNFLIPGVILFGLGVLNSLAFLAALRRMDSTWVGTVLAFGGLTIWFWIEIAILQVIHWLHFMWGLPVIVGSVLALPLIPASNDMIRKLLLICGILASLLYVVLNIIIPLQWPGYDSITQTVSELSAIGAPTRKLWMVLCTPYSILMIAFAYGVWKSAFGNRKVRFAGALLIAYGITGIFWPFAPMHLRETLAAGGATFSDTMHISLAVVTEIIYLIALGLTAAALGRKFRVYSITTVLILLVFGILTFIEAPNVNTNQPTPLIGVWERINIGVFLLWVIVLSINLFDYAKRENNPAV